MNGHARRFRELLGCERPLVLPGAHDALSALLVKQAGFPAYFIGGFPLVAVRYGLPDLGLAALGEMSSAVRDMLAVADLPVLVDGDNGYGDVKTVAHTVHTYERMGVAALFFEDQVLPKRCGHMAGKSIVPGERMAAQIRAAKAACSDPDTFIIARTDARDVEGLDAALRRAERYLRAGADGLFIEAPRDLDELARIGRAFDVPLMANMLEGGKTPILKPADLADLGYRIVVYGISLLVRITRVMQEALADLKSGELGLVGTGVGFAEFQRIIDVERWSRIEDAHGPNGD
jgi:2-methylisocitrate lyase-like PEP mutase family enzyme